MTIRDDPFEGYPPKLKELLDIQFAELIDAECDLATQGSVCRGTAEEMIEEIRRWRRFFFAMMPLLEALRKMGALKTQ